MREEHGFRITDYKIENDATPPRLCFEFSDPLSMRSADFAPYFRQDPGPFRRSPSRARKLCVEGLKHGARYKITARKGLPSSVDEDLARDARIRDLCPRPRALGAILGKILCAAAHRPERHAAHFGQQPTRRSSTLYRIGDRSLIDSVIDSNFLRPDRRLCQAETIADRKGAKVWEGTLDTPSPLNEEVTTAFPVDEALGKLDPASM